MLGSGEEPWTDTICWSSAGAGAFGTPSGPVSLDGDARVRRQHAIVREPQPPPAPFERAGAKVYLADARFVDAHTGQADGHRVQADRIGKIGRASCRERGEISGGG